MPADLNYFDIFVAIIAAFFAFQGFRDGIVQGAIKLAGFIGVIVLMVRYADAILQEAKAFEFLHPTIAGPLAFVVVFTVAMLLVNLVAKIVKGMVDLTPIKFIDSFFGILFGVLKSLLIAGVMAFIIMFTPRDMGPYRQLQASRTGYPLIKGVSTVLPFVKEHAVKLLELYSPLPDFVIEDIMNKQLQSLPGPDDLRPGGYTVPEERSDSTSTDATTENADSTDTTQ